MTCKDCYHNNVCGLYGADDCDFFKDKRTIAEVVRCKDCFHRNNLGTPPFCSRSWLDVSDNDYCSYGAKMGGGNKNATD